MAQEDVDIVRKTLAAYADGRDDEFQAYLHPDLEMVQLAYHPEAGTYRGPQASVQSMQSWEQTFDDFRWEVEELIDTGGHVVAVVREWGRARGSAVELDHSYATVYTVREGKIARMEWFHDRGAALEAIGARA